MTVNNAPRPTPWLDELIDLTPHRDDALLAARGAVYNVLRNAFGLADFEAACHSTMKPRAARPGVLLNGRQIVAFFDGGPEQAMAVAA